jgi:hypothetical protein
VLTLGTYVVALYKLRHGPHPPETLKGWGGGMMGTAIWC